MYDRMDDIAVHKWQLDTSCNKNINIYAKSMHGQD